MSAVDLRDVVFGWRTGQPLLAIERLEVAPGERVFISGPSGSGKSTLLGLIGGVLTPTSGSVRVLGESLGELSAARRDALRVDRIGFIFQMFNLLPYLSVRDNVALPCRFSARRRARALTEATDIRTEAERQATISGSAIFGHYEKLVDRESAYEKLTQRTTDRQGTTDPGASEGQGAAEGGHEGGFREGPRIPVLVAAADARDAAGVIRTAPGIHHRYHARVLALTVPGREGGHHLIGAGDAFGVNHGDARLLIAIEDHLRGAVRVGHLSNTVKIVIAVAQRVTFRIGSTGYSPQTIVSQTELGFAIGICDLGQIA
jgi:hypothetical protein